MTSDEAISIMNVIVHMLEPQYDTDRIEEAVEMAIKALDQQPTDAVDRVTIKEYLESFEVAQPKMGSSSENPNKWIPVSERLPKAGEYVGSIAKYYLVQNEYGDMLVARYTHSGYWEQIYHLKPYADEIVAWMPLPQKYKEEGWANE